MASPQRENGTTDIANDIVEAIMKIHLSGYENRVLWAIFRKTYGWHKKEDWITNSQIAKMTDIAESHISRTMKILIQRKIVTKNGKKLSFQKNYDLWVKLPKMVSIKKLPIQDKKLPKMVNKVTKNGNSKLPKMVDTKQTTTKQTTTKQTIQKKERFLKLWNKYPKKLGKDAAIIHFKAQVKTEKDWQNINKALNNYIESENVKNGNIQYIQNGSTWFNKRWQDWIDYIEPQKPNNNQQSKLQQSLKRISEFGGDDE